MGIINVFGLSSCDNTNKALRAFKKQHIQVDFHDLRLMGLGKGKLAYWCNEIGWEKVLNRKSTTWRSLSPAIQQLVIDETSAINIMIQYPSLVKRPVIEMNDHVTVGLTESILANNKK